MTSDNYIGSGAFRCAVDLARTLRNTCGYDVFVVTPNAGDGAVLLEQAHISSICIPSRDWIVPITNDFKKGCVKLVERFFINHFAVLRLISIIKKCDVDLVHCNTTWTYVGARAARCCNVPFVWHLREMLREGLRCKIVNEEMGFRLMRQASRRIAISNTVREEYVSAVEGLRIDRVYDGVDTARFYRPDHRIFERETLTFVFVGSYQEQKGHDVFCRACVDLWRKSVRNFKIIFVGGWVEEHCRAYFEDAGMLQNVSFCGMQPEPVEFTEQADIAFVCSRAEGFGLVTVEAMLAGCLVIGANRAGTAELIRHGETGLLFKMTDAKEHDDLVRQIEYALANPEHCRRMAAAGREYMVKNMTVERNAQEVSALYDDVLRSHDYE